MMRDKTIGENQEKKLTCPKCGSDKLFKEHSRHNQFNFLGLLNLRLAPKGTFKCVECNFEFRA
ncbi:hypothetical protein [Pedobacter paludis]|uniref:Uncharacterized protein n=1 Tax=Pedobacter paludis TaxID=2203212 RepID=A0A317EY60_9SPHI|nr:hypothetical protein [Pedobacter paludis]PWS31774.1 hypothetical protein DF947_08215 [Pedobacter paludis]